jgi:hypothetical protein
LLNIFLANLPLTFAACAKYLTGSRFTISTIAPKAASAVFTG